MLAWAELAWALVREALPVRQALRTVQWLLALFAQRAQLEALVQRSTLLPLALRLRVSVARLARQYRHSLLNRGRLLATHRLQIHSALALQTASAQLKEHTPLLDLRSIQQAANRLPVSHQSITSTPDQFTLMEVDRRFQALGVRM